MTIIFLNGAGSSGKSSIAKAIQHLSAKPWMVIGIDSVIDMMPADYMGFGSKSHQGFQFVTRVEDGKPAIAVKSGPYGEQIIEVIPKIAGLLANAGLDCIIDEVLLENKAALKKYTLQLANHTVYFIAVTCSLEAMEEREILRGDRAIGLSRDQYPKIHAHNLQYDLEVNTTSASSFTSARQILEYISNNPRPTSFKELEKNL